MIKTQLPFKRIVAYGSLLLLFVIIIIGSVNVWETPQANKLSDFYLYNTLANQDYESVHDFLVVDTVEDMSHYDFVHEVLHVGFELESIYDDPETSYVLEFSNPYFYRLDLYEIDEKGELHLISKRGTSVKTTASLVNPRPFFSFSYEDVVGKSFLAVIESRDPIGFDVIFAPEEEYFEEYSKRMLLIHVYMGLMLALFLYNIILFFMIKDRVYLYYSFYVLFIALAQLSLLGISHIYLLGENPTLFSLSIVGFTSIAGILAVFFLRTFLKTAHFIPRLNRYLFIIVVLYALGFIMRLLGYVYISHRIIDLTGLIGVILFITAGALVSRKGYRPAVYFLIAWGMFLAGLVIFILQNQGIISMRDLANLPMLIGTALEAILLSLALADRINILKREKEKEQREKVTALRENERLIKEQNIYLEKMVHSRTEELEQTLKNLQNTQTQLVNQEKMASLGQLTAGIAHEINNPINFVSSNISPLKRDLNDIMEVVSVYRAKGKAEFSAESQTELKDLEEELELDYLIEEVEQLLRGIEDGAKRTVDIVRGLRLFSRVDEQDVKKVDIHDGLDSTLILLSSSMQGKIKVVKEYGELPMIECLAGKVNQVFMNIINNAIHALLEPQYDIKNPTLHIRTIPFEEEVHIEIRDNGPGMPDHIKEKIFEPFFTTKEVGKGTGLGLSIVYTVIENHHGRLEVNSKLNEGTTFVIVLPINQNTNKDEE